MHLRLFRHFVPLSAVILGCLDGLLISWYVVAMDQPSSGFDKVPHGLLSLISSPTAIFWFIAVIVMLSIGLYGPRNFATFGMLVNRIAVASALMLLISFAFPPHAHAGTVAATSAQYPAQPVLIWLLWVTLTRGAVAAGYELGLLKRRILVLGSGSEAARIAELAENQRLPFTPVAFVGLAGEDSRIRGDSYVGHAGDDVNSLAELAKAHGVSEIVVATSERRGLPVRQLLLCKIAGIQITEFLDFWERETRTIDLETLRPSWLFYSDGFRCRVLDAVLKRGFDISVSLAILLLTLPLQLLTAVLVKLESPGPIFYRQERIGRYGRVFTILKFRSMRVDAEGDGNPRWAAERDPRVTRIGAVIRKLRIDELPQLINVLRGEMSFVGPRPERPLFVEQLTQAIPYYAERHWVRPGITGWAQVNYPYGASIHDAKRKLSFDLYYLKNASIFLDFLILLQTIPTVLARSGAR
jgi:sugar transferase (PEP-CTERM system associated)